MSKASRRRFIQMLPLGAGGALLAACAETSTSTPAAQSVATTAAVQAANPPAQTGSGQTITLKMQSTWPTKDIFHEDFLDWGKKVEALSNGRLKIEILPSGAVVPAFQLIDAVNTGTLDGGHGVAAYWFGKRKAFSLFGTGPSFGMDAEMLLGWLNYGGGKALYDELLKEMKLNVVSFFHGPMPTQPLGWFKNEIKGPDDFKGQKYRTVGMSIDVFTDLGASVVALPGGEVVPSLERGVIDSAEFNNPSSDKLLGFQDVRKILMVQSYHQPLECFEILINKGKYDSLPADLKEVVRIASMAQSADFTWKMMDRNSKDLKELKDKGVKVVKTPKSVLEAQLRAWDKIIANESKADPYFDKVIKSQREWAGRVVPLRQEIMVENETAYNYYFASK